MTATIGIDLGTSGLRAVVVDADGAVLAQGATAIAPEQRRNPEAWWAALESVLAGLDARDQVMALAVDGTSGTILPIDRAGAPLASASLYNDRAPVDAVASVAAHAPGDSAAHGATSPLARLLAWRDLPRLARILHEADWLAGRLVGRFDRTDQNNALKTGYDPRRDQWPDWIEDLGVDRDRLPSVVPAGAPLGRIDGAVARRVGLPPACMVAAGTTDGCASFLATGAAAGEGVSALGSTLTVKLLCPRPLAAPRYGVYSHCIDGLWLAGGASNAGGAALAQVFAPAEIAELSARIDPQVPSPHDFYPLPAPGERFPRADPNLMPRMTPRPDDDAEYLAGLFEGLARIEAEAYRRLAGLGGPTVTRVLSVGGAAGNDAFTAIRARVLGVPVVRAAHDEAAYGTALLARRALPGFGA